MPATKRVVVLAVLQQSIGMFLLVVTGIACLLFVRGLLAFVLFFLGTIFDVKSELQADCFAVLPWRLHPRRLHPHRCSCVHIPTVAPNHTLTVVFFLLLVDSSTECCFLFVGRNADL